MLTIYSASAGTGKTHTLTGEYLALLFKGNEAYRYILAVTFTNKATAEMKSRIIKELFNLADNRPSDYLSLLSEEGEKSETEIRNQAGKILITILHDYSSFNISTIDHFFQRTIRSFTREIGLQGNYRVEMDEERMIEEAVESMLSGLDIQKEKDLTNWILRFIEGKIEENGSWDIRKDIIRLGRELFKETYKSYSEKIKKSLTQKQFLSGYKEKLYKIIPATRKAAKELGERGISLIEKHGMNPSDFKGGSRSAFFYFQKLAEGSMDEPTKTFCKLIDNVEEYMAKTAADEKKHAAENIYAHGMNELIKEVVTFFDKLTEYHTANEILRNFYALGILSDLSLHIAQWREENNKMFIADTSELLGKVINGCDVPFIYEKTGTRISHYMIDEFQDTSAMQWANFRPLLKDSLDNGRKNLIVGDVKQSIYRFRNSDWTLLDYKIKQDFAKQVKEKKLDVNWRSCRNIVVFNNMLFTVVPRLLQSTYNEEAEQSSLPEEEKRLYRSRIISVYEDACQHVSPPLFDKDGHVQVRFYTDNEEQTWKKQCTEELPHIIEKLQDNGYRLCDIAILTRTGSEGLLAADTLLEYKETHPESTYRYDIISEDSVTISSARSVQWIVAMLKYLNQPDTGNNYSLAQMAYAVLRRKRSKDDAASSGIKEMFPALPPEKMKQLRQLSGRSLYELSEGIFRIFQTDFPGNEIIFIQAFLDTVSDYELNENTDIGKFLEWWDEKGRTQKIMTPDSQNAIRIMTIHKSKGLGFKAVVLPFADWKMDQKETLLWCHPTDSPFDEMQLVPVRYNHLLKKTHFANDYLKEKLHAYIDNLNTLYVAFTRAKEELIVMSPRPKTKTMTLSRLLWDALGTAESQPLDTEKGLYERGKWFMPTTEKSHNEAEELQISRFYSVSPYERVQLRLYGKDRFQENKKREYGLLMHDLLSNIERSEDIEPALSAKLLSGEINRTEQEHLKHKLTAFTTFAKQWFDGSMTVMNELDILFGKGQSCRPDRIMINKENEVFIVDYKFGEQKEKKHHHQIEKYVNLVREMGYQKVFGHLWYITLNETSHEQIFLIHEHDYPGGFHVTNKNQIINT